MNKRVILLKDVFCKQFRKQITQLFLVGAIGLVPISAFAQVYQITMKKSNAPLSSVIAEIEKESGYTFFYNDDQINLGKKISIDVTDASLDVVLNHMFKNTGYVYRIVNNQIVVSKSSEGGIARTSSVNTTQQQKSVTIKGVVKDAHGEPVIGASVVEAGTTNGTVTDFDGNFVLTVSGRDKHVLISYIGYTTKNITLKDGQTSVNVILEEDSELLDEVVVVGYGTQKKVNLTGSVAAISSEEIKDRVQTNVLAAVQGTVPGVTVISRPGSTPSINFRGRGNLGTSSPLYVIDGAIADADLFSNLDPNSIETISFLKDASSSAIYGSRAAYGVVLVTTKRGQKEKMNVSYSGYVGMKMPTYLPDVLDSWDYATLLNEAFYNRDASNGKNAAYSEDEIKWFRDGSKPDYYPNTKWADLVLDNPVVTTQHSLNFSGGSDKVRFFSGLGYLYDDKFMPGQSSQRYNLDINVAADVTKWLTLKSGVKFIRSTNKTEHGVASIGNFLMVSSTMVAQQSNGEWGSIAGGKAATQSFMNGNPLRALSKNNWSDGKTDNTMIDLGFDLKPVKGLVISGQGAFKGWESKSRGYTALQDNVKNFETGAEIPGTGVYTNEMNMFWQSENRTMYTLTARYDWSNKVHNIGILAGTSYEHYKYERLYAKWKDFVTDDLEDMTTGGEISKDQPDQNSYGTPLREYKILSYFGRLNYSLLDRYLFEANLRADASSRFHKDNRWGIFPSFSAGWRINQENFMQQIDWINNLKIRASWGTLGNINNVGNYDYFQLYNNGADYNFDNEAVKGVLESKPANEKLGWETVALTDIGVDFDIFNGLLSLTADYYVKNTSDILLSYNVPLETGIWSNPSQNIAKVRNSGFELALTHRKSFGDFSYMVSANIATNHNEIKDMGESDDIIQNGGDKIRYILREGESIGSFFGLKTDGLYTQEEIDAGHYYTYGRKPKAGDIKYVPQRENVEWGSAINGEDRTIIGKDVPDFTYGINLNLQYKDFELSIFGQGVSGTMAGFESEQVSAFMLNSNPRKFHLGRWTEENPNPRAVYPRIYGGHSLDDYNQYFSDYQLFDADYFRIKTISLGYRVPSNLISKWGMSSLKFFLTGENLFTLRADHVMKDFDPEASSGRGIGSLGTKSVAFGVNVSF
ncbi:TonB-dependent receptor [Parabacteroides goldsteinii]|uniref:TonB-dependent receptor n=1 Tax=Parabacteroides goldsteinii TaxID=328812 RepID=UPI00266FB113|nr:TonB-dependent receptor [Parabacteroides goldsteinii]